MSVSALADNCGTNTETVTGILAGIRDEIVDLVIGRKSNVSLNLGFGILNLRSGGTVEFKSNSITSVENDFDKLPDDYDRFSSSVISKTKSLN